MRQRIKDRIQERLRGRRSAGAVSGDDSTPLPLEGDDIPRVPGTHRMSLQSGGRTRSFWLHLPTGYRPGERYPMVMVFHGGGGSGAQAQRSYRMNELADEKGFICVHPDGTGRFESWLLVWNVGFISSRHGGEVDDVAFVDELIGQLLTKVAADPGRVYATGMSNGAILSHHLAARLPHRFAAIAPVAGTIGGRSSADSPLFTCPRPDQPVPILMIQGMADLNIPFEGGLQQKSFPGTRPERIMVSQADSIAFWLDANQCLPDGVQSLSQDGNVIRTEYSDRLGRLSVVTVHIRDGGHSWPGGEASPLKVADPPSDRISANRVMWEFFQRYSR